MITKCYLDKVSLVKEEIGGLVNYFINSIGTQSLETLSFIKETPII